MKKQAMLTALFLLLCLLSAGCGGSAVPAAAEPPAPSATAAPTATPTPAPTATPEPTPAPLARWLSAEALRANVLEPAASFVLPSLVRVTRNVYLYSEPDAESASVRYRADRGDPANNEYLLLDAAPVTDASGRSFLHVRALRDGAEGYLDERRTTTSKLGLTPADGLVAMCFADVAVSAGPSDSAAVLARESYHLARVLGETETYYYALTQDGNTGFLKKTQVVPADETTAADCLARCETLPAADARFTPEAFAAAIAAATSAASSEQLIVETLASLGLEFEPYYYFAYTKDLKNDEVYPRFYKDDVYNTLAFKLFNTAGNLVYYDGAQTQWDYIPAGDPLEPGDVVFFTAVAEGEEAVLPEMEMVFRGTSSGYITGCGVYLGDDALCTVENGKVVTVSGFSKDARYAALDCARRIHTAVHDDKTQLIERLIAQVYDMLGTPYVIDGVGDFEFDCSGLVYWCFNRMDVRSLKHPDELLARTTASGFSVTSKYLWDGRTIQLVHPVKKEDGRASLDGFERGDIIFLLGESRQRVGHIMIYLGGGRVIHSTRITRYYSGTLVANFRPALQSLYYTAWRIDGIE